MRDRLPVLVLVLLALGLNWPYLLSGFQGDDIIFLNLFRQDPLPYPRWEGPWSFTDPVCIERLWWFEGDDASGGFWRPIPGLLLEGSVRLFGERAFPLHLLSLLLHAGVTVGVYFLARSLVRHRGVAFLAGLFFVACEDHSMTIGWIATVTDLLCALAVILAMLAWLGWLRHRRARWMILALFALVVALGSKESAATAPISMALLGILFPRGTADLEPNDEVRPGLLRRIPADPGAWLAPLVLMLAYLAAYAMVGPGGVSTIVYFNPLADPVRFAGQLFSQMPVMWLATLSPVPPSLTMFMPELMAPLAIAGALIAALFAAGLWTQRRNRVVIWSLLAYLVTMAPSMGTDAAERLLYVPLVFAATPLAILASRIGPLARRLFTAQPVVPRLARAAGWWAVAAVLLPGILLAASLPYYYGPSFGRPARDIGSIAPHLEDRDPVVILVNAPSPFITLYTNDVLTWLRDRPTEVWLLAAPNARMSIERTGETAFALRADRGGWLSNMFAAMVRTRSTFDPGHVFDTPHFTATLLELTSSRTDVLAVRFEMKRRLDDPAVAFFEWDGTAYVPLDLAAMAVGTTRELADTSDIWKSM